MNEIIHLRQWTVSNGKAVVVSPQTDSLFYVYSLPDFQYQYMCGTKGEGPNDFSPWAGFLQSGNGDTGTLWMRNKGDDFEYYTVADKGIYKKGTTKRFLKKGTFGADYIMPSGKYIISLRNIKGEQHERMYTRKASDGVAVDSINISSLVKEQYDDNGNVYQRSSIIGASVLTRGNKVAVIYNFIDRVELYNVSAEGKITMTKAIGEKLTDKRVEEVESFRKTQSGSKRMYGVVNEYATDENIYSYFIDAEFDFRYADKISNGQPDVTFNKKQIRVYSWSGEYLHLYDLEYPATSFIVSPDDKYIYT
ncbi:MAG: hypothetical protein PHD21_08280, partial [Flavobacteriales bacterium]|nr:hypothetical protein [Flavobacteriales bacterium]